MDAEQRYGFDDAHRAFDFVDAKLREAGLEIDDVKDGVILGSGLGSFPQEQIEQGAVEISFADIFEELDLPPPSRWRCWSCA